MDETILEKNIRPDETLAERGGREKRRKGEGGRKGKGGEKKHRIYSQAAEIIISKKGEGGKEASGEEKEGGRGRRKQESWRPSRARAARAGLGPVDGPPPMAARCQVEVAPRGCNAACAPWSLACSGGRCASRAADVAPASLATRRSPRRPRRGDTRN